ncbi:trypco2 family protein [Ponticoccus alexandrii]|uniref:Trypsin-co-occurring domain-containing protein n=1 Tax=Ponticoccus alexandrii TaxID=1943633 RepID=A0ABX7FEE2_9RHOB|nr:trypco2 family protein [Ponticoccus alexandrii]ETA51880.1 hypothetical protein P279_11605 [Rhodobacteraceae bacterium PD-2]QRF68063.1 hypothetical protein GQA70_18170 [Ponticoccus alexandrii]
MKLSSFIEKSLLEVLEGVRKASEQDLAIAPGRVDDKIVWTERLVEFEVNVEVETAAKGGGKILSVIDVGGDLKRASSHKLKFSVPVHMNVQKET